MALLVLDSVLLVIFIYISMQLRVLRTDLARYLSKSAAGVATTPVNDAYDDADVVLKCAFCGTESILSSSLVASVVVAAPNTKALVEWVDREIHCDTRPGRLDFEESFEPVADEKDYGCGMPLTAAFMQHPDVIEMIARKPGVISANAEARRAVGLAPESAPDEDAGSGPPGDIGAA